MVVTEVFELPGMDGTRTVYRFNNGRQAVEIWPDGSDNNPGEFMVFTLPFAPSKQPTPAISPGEERVGGDEDLTYPLCTAQLLALEILGGE